MCLRSHMPPLAKQLAYLAVRYIAIGPKYGNCAMTPLKKAASSAKATPSTNGPLRVDLTRTLNILMSALNDTPWGQIAPHVISAAATDSEAKMVINDFMQQRATYVESIFKAAAARGEVTDRQSIHSLVEMTIAVPYFRKFVIGLPLDQDWLKTHVDTLCRLAIQYIKC